MAGNLGFQQADQVRIHKSISVRNIQADHPRTAQMSAKSTGQFRSMGSFHDEDNVGPFDKLLRQWRFSVVVQSCRGRFYSRIGSKNLFGGWAAQPVLAAYEKHALHQVLDLVSLKKTAHAVAVRPHQKAALER